jgi:hypothetical protein
MRRISSSTAPGTYRQASCNSITLADFQLRHVFTAHSISRIAFVSGVMIPFLPDAYRSALLIDAP